MALSILIVTFVLFTVGAVLQIEASIIPGLLLLGLGLGFWNIGTLGLMMDMSPVGRAGTFLGFWSMAVTLARGGGITGGGIVRDVGLQLSGSPHIAYALVFGSGTIGLLIAGWCLNHIHINEFKETAAHESNTSAILAGSMD
ncbi:MAG: PucC family protein [Anaerolineae bacterium]|nr:PucC family protein [Anaerolineae bacterium]